MERCSCLPFFVGSLNYNRHWIHSLVGSVLKLKVPRMSASMGLRLQPSFTSLAILLSVLPAAFGFSECGDYYFIGPSDTGVISSPDYPAMYPTYQRCIWLIETSGPEYRVKLTLSYTGERYNGTCADYVEVREGSEYSPLIGVYCDTSTNEVILSGYVWMWILFKSDGLTGSASVMTATFTAHYNATPASNTTKPYRDCNSYEFECRNKMCAAMSYRCDEYNDCGCKENCDEDECAALSISKGFQIGVAIGAGLITFLFVSIFAFLFEGQHTWANTLSEAKRERETHDEARRKRVSRAFSKFIGANSGGSLTRITDSSFNNASFKAPAVGANHSNNGPMTKVNVPELMVTDIDA